MDARTDGHDAPQSAIDVMMMERCIRLSANATQSGELPFASLICRGNELVVETTNRVARDGDVTRHAELIAISEAQKVLGRRDLADCTLYTTVEPCAMCSYAIRETRIARVIYSIKSPVMGGLSKWNVLRDPELSQAMPEVFGAVPEVIAGLLRHEAEKVWSKWNPVLLVGHQARRIFGRRSSKRLRASARDFAASRVLSQAFCAPQSQGLKAG